MDLKDFIKSTLTQIVQAVEESNTELADSQAVISPKGGYCPDGRHVVVMGQNSTKYSELIEFDVAVTAREEKGNKGKAGVSVLSIQLGTERNKEQENTTVSRIKFKIPILLPQHTKGVTGTNPTLPQSTGAKQSTWMKR